MTSSIVQKAFQTVIKRPGKVWEDALLIAGVSLFPLLYMTYRGWTNRWLVALFILALVFSIFNWKLIKTELDDRFSKLLILTLASPFLAILLSQLLRNDININAYDGPLRFLLASLIFLYLKHKQVDFLYIIQYIAPISLLIAVGAIFYYPETSNYWGGRYASYFVDPLTFGGYALAIGFTCLFQLDVKKDPHLLSVLKIIGFACGLFLSFGSGSRSGWIAIPFVFALWVFFNHKNKNLIINISLILTLVLVTTLFLNEYLQQRTLSIFQEIFAWITNRTEKEQGSGGIRLNMWKISIILFLESPLYGYGSVENFKHLLNEPMIKNHISEIAISSIGNGPHNEILALMLRAGLFGLISGLLLFLASLYIFIKKLKANSKNISAQVGICFVLCISICSLSIEVFNLKYTTSFYALMLACLGAQALSFDQRALS